MNNLLPLVKLAEKWRASRAHTYASENADHYRGFDAGQLRAAQDLEAALAEARSATIRGSWEDGGPRLILSKTILKDIIGDKP